MRRGKEREREGGGLSVTVVGAMQSEILCDSSAMPERLTGIHVLLQQSPCRWAGSARAVQVTFASVTVYMQLFAMYFALLSPLLSYFSHTEDDVMSRLHIYRAVVILIEEQPQTSAWSSGFLLRSLCIFSDAHQTYS